MTGAIWKKKAFVFIDIDFGYRSSGWHSSSRLIALKCWGWKQGGGSVCRGQSGCVSGVAAAWWMMRHTWSGVVQL